MRRLMFQAAAVFALGLASLAGRPVAAQAEVAPCAFCTNSCAFLGNVCVQCGLPPWAGSSCSLNMAECYASWPYLGTCSGAPY